MSKKIETSLKAFFRDKTILVTGGTGSIGRQIVKKLTSCSPKKIIVFSKDDSKQYMMKNEYGDHPEVAFALGDVRDASRVRQLVKGVDIIFHAAALKQVPTCEDNPFEAVQTNIIGGQHIIEAAIEHEVSHVVNISTDKAVNYHTEYITKKKKKPTFWLLQLLYLQFLYRILLLKLHFRILEEILL